MNNSPEQVGRTSDAIKKLVRLQPKTASIVVIGKNSNFSDDLHESLKKLSLKEDFENLRKIGFIGVNVVIDYNNYSAAKKILKIFKKHSVDKNSRKMRMIIKKNGSVESNCCYCLDDLLQHFCLN